MDINRNQFFLAGLLLLLMGVQFRLVDSFVLTEQATAEIAKRTATKESDPLNMRQFLPNLGPAAPRKVLRVPEWLGWAVGSIGAVLVLHSLAMPRPGGS